MPFAPSSFLFLVARMLLVVLPFVTSSDALCYIRSFLYKAQKEVRNKAELVVRPGARSASNTFTIFRMALRLGNLLELFVQSSRCVFSCCSYDPPCY